MRESPSKRVSSLLEIFSAQSTSSNLEMDKAIFWIDHQKRTPLHLCIRSLAQYASDGQELCKHVALLRQRRWTNLGDFFSGYFWVFLLELLLWPPNPQKDDFLAPLSHREGLMHSNCYCYSSVVAFPFEKWCCNKGRDPARIKSQIKIRYSEILL